MRALILGAMAWGVLAFGGVYPWAYWPLFMSLTVIGVLCWREGPTDPGTMPMSAVLFALLATCAFIQLVPLPLDVLKTLSPSTDKMLQEYEIGYASGLVHVHALSMVPGSTQLALAACVALAVFSAGTAKWMSRGGVGSLTDGIVVLGVVVAAIALTQRASQTDKIYGFWTPVFHSFHIYGPFVNRNHFAGWMMMVLGTSIGVLCARLAVATRGVRRDWRSRVLWIASPEANQLLLLIAAVGIMAVSLALTLARSAFICSAALVAVIGAALLLKRGHNSRRGALTLTLVLGAGALGAWAASVNRIFDRFTADALLGRMAAWRAAARMAHEFLPAGVGLNSFNAIMTFYEPRTGVHWDAAHNDYLQLAVEGGLLVAIPFFCTLLMAIGQLRDRFRSGLDDDYTFWLRVGAVAGLCAIAMQEAVDFSLQLPGNAAMAALLGAVALHVPRSPQKLHNVRGRT